MKRILLISVVTIMAHAGSFAQADSLMSMLDDATNTGKKEPVTNTFKATRLINGSTIENLAAGVLDTRISHRFGQLNMGTQNFWGIDNATTRLGIDYGITKYLMVGVGHSVMDKEDDGFVKIKLLPQKKNGTPVSVSYYGGALIQTNVAPTLASDQKWYLSNRFTYVNQILVARKFNERLSLQLMPTVFHYNIVDSTKYQNNIYAMGIGGRMKITKRLAVTGEYYYRFTGLDNNINGSVKTYNSLSLGLDIETGGHVFQLFFTNSPGISERVFIAQTTDSWTKGQMHFGFNISRVFTVVKPKGTKDL